MKKKTKAKLLVGLLLCAGVFLMAISPALYAFRYPQLTQTQVFLKKLLEIVSGVVLWLVGLYLAQGVGGIKEDHKDV